VAVEPGEGFEPFPEPVEERVVRKFTPGAGFSGNEPVRVEPIEPG